MGIYRYFGEGKEKALAYIILQEASFLGASLLLFFSKYANNN